MKKTSKPNPVKSLGYIKCYSSPRPVALVILLDTTIRRSAVDQEDLKHTGNQKKGHISQGNQQFYFLQVCQRLY